VPVLGKACFSPDRRKERTTSGTPHSGKPEVFFILMILASLRDDLTDSRRDPVGSVCFGLIRFQKLTCPCREAGCDGHTSPICAHITDMIDTIRALDSAAAPP